MVLRALTINGQKSPGASLTTAEQNQYLDASNAMLDSWSVDRTMVYSVLQENFSLSVSTGSYTIGTGGTFNTNRPSKIVNAFVRDSSNFDSPLTIIPQPSYAAIRVKGTGVSYPQYLYYDAADVAGLATIYLYPTPAQNLSLYINSYKALQSFAAMSTALVLPPGYQRAIEFNLALELDNGQGGVSDEAKRIARDSLDNIKTINLPETISRMDSALVGGAGGSILSGP